MNVLMRSLRIKLWPKYWVTHHSRFRELSLAEQRAFVLAASRAEERGREILLGLGVYIFLVTVCALVADFIIGVVVANCLLLFWLRNRRWTHVARALLNLERQDE